MNEDQNLIDRMPDGPLSERELQETRHSNHMIIDKMVNSDDLIAWGAKVDQLWWAFGWLVLTVKNWKALGIAGMIALLIGGHDMVELITARLNGFFQ